MLFESNISTDFLIENIARVLALKLKRKAFTAMRRYIQIVYLLFIVASVLFTVNVFSRFSITPLSVAHQQNLTRAPQVKPAAATTTENVDFAARSQMWNCMRYNRTPYSKLSYPNAPIKSLPSFNELLLPISAIFSICDPNEERLRVLVILNTPWRDDIRTAIRVTYSNFSLVKDLKSKWTRMFLVGIPRNQNESRNLLLENKQYGDIVVANVTEGYFGVLTLKMLIAFKFVSCFCPNAEYFVKSDDDNYVKIGALDDEISKFQEKADKNRSSAEMRMRKHQPIYLGWAASNNPIRPPSKDKWSVTLNEYSEKLYPPYMTGGLYVFSTSVVHMMAIDCPYLCVGLRPQRYATNKNKPCFWKFEDAFMGSCRYFTQEKVATGGDNKVMAITKWRGVRQFINVWNKFQEKPVYVTDVAKSQDFYEIATLFTYKDQLSEGHPVSVLLSHLLGLQ